jgi:hypothetical protein
MANTYDVGDLVRVTGTFTNAASVAQDPTAVLFKYKDPSGNKTTLTYNTDVSVVKSATGVYYVDVDVDEIGRWYYRWQGTGTGQSAGESYFDAQASRL